MMKTLKALIDMRITCYAMVCAIAALFANTAAAADAYLLNDQDKLLLRVGQWSAPEQSFVFWNGLSGEYAIGPDGKLSIALVGSVEAQGKTIEELTVEISQRIQNVVGTTAPPAVSLEIIAYKPIYVGGSVNAPGAYPYRFGMTVQQAIAVAGGPPRAAIPQETVPREAIRLRGEIEGYKTRIARLEIEQQRFEAEIAAYSGQQGEAGTLPLSQTDAAALEAKIFETNQNSIEAQQTRISDLRTLLQVQIKRLTDEIKLRDEQIVLAAQELANVQTLQEKGLAVNARLTSLSTALNDLEAKRIQLEIAKLTAEQQLNLTQRDELSLLDDARLRRMSELKSSQIELDDVKIRLATALSLYSEAVARGTIDDEADLELPDPIYRVTRHKDDTVEQLVLPATGVLKPGDTLQVVLEDSFEASGN
ncbi:polysaccharide biosynthesis/export family protein [Actibacterium lipolyticum]|nr:polysaccharide biosynthesis/export family protein [Actibacterium lipolyticum]